MKSTLSAALKLALVSIIVSTLTGTVASSAQTRAQPGAVVNTCPSVSADGTSPIALGVDPTQAAYSVWSNGTVAFSLPLQNAGTQPAHGVTVTSFTIQNGSYLGPTSLPLRPGTIEANDLQPIYANATVSGWQTAGMFNVSFAGTFAFQNRLCPYQVAVQIPLQKPGNGGTLKSFALAPTHTVYTATYSPALPHSEEDPNGEPAFFPPLGQPHYFFATPPLQSTVDLHKAFNPVQQPPPATGSNEVVFVRNQQGGTYSALPPDPSAAGATPTGFALISANNASGGNAAAVSYSTNFGSTFTTVDLTKATGFNDPTNPKRTDFFPESDGGLCCDQVVHYIPGRNLLVWELQYWSPNLTVRGLPQKGQNRLRIAYATPQAAAADFLHAWTWFDVSPATLGDNNATDWMDYPDLSFSNDYLYINVDHGFWNAGKDKNGNVIGQQVNSDRRFMVRASLNDMASQAGSVNLIYYEPIKSGVVKSHFAQSSPDTMYYAAQPDTSTLSVFKDPDSSPYVPSPTDISITSHCANTGTNPCDYSAIAGDGLDWNQAPHGVLGSTFVSLSPFCFGGPCTYPTNLLYFAFDGARDAANGRPNPYVRVEKIDTDKMTRISELDIWNSGFSYATPALISHAGSNFDEVAFSLATDGGSGFANNAVGFLGDFVAYVTTTSNGTQDSGGTVRYGDYFSARTSISPGDQYGEGIGYSTLGYGVTQAVPGSTCAASGCNVTLQYVLFGRDSDLFPSPPVIIH